MRPSLPAALGAGLALPACGLSVRYRRDMNAAHARLAAVDRRVISTPWGAVEYADSGSGEPVLIVHGIFHNCVGGLLSVRDLVTNRRLIAPSRFGYLGSSMPPNATPSAQADAFAALLDALGIGQDELARFFAESFVHRAKAAGHLTPPLRQFGAVACMLLARVFGRS